MLDEKMKLEEYFKEEIQRVSDIQISGIEREIEQIRKKTIASLEQSAQTEAGMLRETELREKQSEHAIALSRLHEDTNRKLMATKIIDLPKFFSFSEKAPMAAGAAAATAIPAPNAESPVDKAAAIKPRP